MVAQGNVSQTRCVAVCAFVCCVNVLSAKQYMIFFGCLFVYLFICLFFDMALQGHASRFLYLEAQSLYIHYATLLSADICLRIKTKGASFIFSFFTRQHTHAWLHRQDCWLCIKVFFFPFSFCKVAHTCMCILSFIF